LITGREQADDHRQLQLGVDAFRDLAALPNSHGAVLARDALDASIAALPQLRRSLSGIEVPR